MELVFKFGNEIVVVKIKGSQVTFTTMQSLLKTFVPIDALKLSRAGVIKEFPDLEDSEDWKQEAIRRFKKHIRSLTSEQQIMNYLIKDLEPHGYKLYSIRRDGFRTKKVKGDDYEKV
jgi:hypothetical protein